MRETAKAFVALCFVWFANAAFAQLPGRLAPDTGIVTGTIQIDGGGSMAGVRVAIISTDDAIGASLVSLAETDAAGHFRLTGIPQGHYYVVAGPLSRLTWFPSEVVVEPAKTISNINFKVPADSRRPPSVPSTRARSDAEFKAYQRSSNEGNLYARIKLLLSFEKDFPQSALLSQVYDDLVDLYIAKGDPATAMSYGDKLLEKDPDNVWALIKVSRAYGLSQRNLRLALQYGEKAVTTVAKLKVLPADARPAEFHGYTAQQWTSTMAALDESAKSNLTWVKQVITWNQNALNAAVRSRR